ncbi:MAG: beta-lactamase family protein [Planctomycetaceae bacterium]|nr:beta-lactamase family protein [Planctomycetales bacterium]MCB9873906.1 beta-lactamase family protein [Planctomycetaceae bacterium]MCB9937400.1 beta-lactamase family protein [Planctomycetaceae bacterium]
MNQLNHRYVAALSFLLACTANRLQAEGLPLAAPDAVGFASGQLSQIDAVVAEGLRDGEMAGCVVCVGRRGKIAYLKPYGHRQVEPTKIDMTVETVFDMASITKPVATATSVMLLVERGTIKLTDRVAEHIPEFAQHGKDAVTIEDLLLHQSGLTPDNALADYLDGPAKAIENVNALSLREQPKTKFMYSDVGFIVLAELIRKKTGQDVHQFSQENLFRPLGLNETGYVPRQELRERAAATEQRDGHWMVGEVHDPRAYHLGGVAGHAGLFSTARDLAVFAQMLLNRGEFGGKRVLAAETLDVMTAGHPVSSGIRGLGWDKQTGYSSNKGDGFSDRAFGHGGFTGTTFWVDPELDLFVIFLSNRLHPDGKGTVNKLAGRIGTIAAEAIER